MVGRVASGKKVCLIDVCWLYCLLTAHYAYRNVWPVNRREMMWTSKAAVQNQITPHCFKTIHFG